VSEIRDYLHSLQQGLAGSDPALIQDALSEAEGLYRHERERLAWAEPLLADAEADRKALDALGAPEARAREALARDRHPAAAPALPPPIPQPPAAPRPPEAAAPEAPWPTFFGVFLAPKAYTSLLYLMLALPISIFFFAWCLTGLGLSLGLMILIIGAPLLILFLGSVRALGLGEGRLVEALLDVRMPRRPPLLPEGRGWLDRLKGLFVDSYTWKCVAYLVLHLPVTVVTFTLAVIGLAFSLGLVATPVLNGIFHEPVTLGLGEVVEVPTWILLVFPVGGILGLAGTLHLALGLGRLHGLLARVLLVRR
jgi:hypothetical protein